MTRTRYDGLTQALHWIMAALVMATWAIGLGREGLPKGDMKTLMLALHMSLGLACLGLLLLRMMWRLTARPIAPVEMPGSVRLAATLGHVGLYVLLIAVPVVGLLAAWIKGRTVGFFGMPLPSPLAVDVATGKLLEGAHEITANALMILAGLHAAAGLAHHYVLKDGTLRRMLPARLAA